jgi:membrane fusion protein (multidrug efflux system)
LDAVANDLTGKGGILRTEERRERLRWILMGGGVLLAVIVALWYYLTSGRYVSTDDSAVMAAQSTISANVPGQVVELDVRDNQRVHRGDVLFRLDERPFQIAVEESQAKLAGARLQIVANKASYRRELANLRASGDTLAYQQHELERQQRLLQSGISSHAQFEQVQHAVELAQSQLSSAEQQVGSVLAMLGGNPDLPVDAHPLVMQAQAELDRAKLNQSYTVVVAPDDGVVD